MRAENAARKAALGPGPQMESVREFALPGHADPHGHEDRTVRVRLLIPRVRPAGLMLYFHGGGWLLGNIDTFDRLGRELARRTGWAVLMVDYSKAPEHPFPAAVHDAWTAVQWARDHAIPEHLPGEGLRMVVAGDSSGGNLAAVVARHARESDRDQAFDRDQASDRAEDRDQASDRAKDSGPRNASTALAGQLLIYPVTDCDLDRPGYLLDAESRDRMAMFWSLYCPGGDSSHPDASPLRARSLRGLPPALVVSAQHDVLNEEVNAYADRLEREAVRVERHLIQGGGHGCLSYWDTVAAADTTLDAIATWLNGL